MVKTDYDNYAFITACYPLSETTTKQVVYVLVRSKKCWAEHNKDFIELELDKLSELGFYTDNIEDVTQTGQGSAAFSTDCSSNTNSVISSINRAPLTILEKDCNDGWERIECDIDETENWSDLEDVSDLLYLVETVLYSFMGSLSSFIENH